MRVVLQRVSEASVSIDNQVSSSIQKGFLILLGIEIEDKIDDIEWLANKIAKLRIFNDDEDKMNLSLKDINGEALVVSQFTLHASTKKGNRPSFIKAAKPDIAIPLYNKFIETLQSKLSTKIKNGEFGANMKVSLINNGPVTITIDSKKRE